MRCRLVRIVIEILKGNDEKFESNCKMKRDILYPIIWGEEVD